MWGKKWYRGSLIAIIGWVLFKRRHDWIGHLLQLSAPRNKVTVTTHLGIKTDDDIVLMTDHYQPDDDLDAPTILIRSPYGRRRTQSSFGWLIEFCARRFAERGYHVVVQDVRGRFDSEGEFDPFVNEQHDGLATIAWLRRQDWFNGRLGTWGASYLGMTQWAIASKVPELKAMMPIFTSTQLRDIILPEESLDMGLIMRWIAIFHTLDTYRPTLWRYSPRITLEVEQRAALTIDQHDIFHEDQHLIGENVPFYQNWLAHLDDTDSLWQEIAQTVDMSQVTAAVHMVAGWHDFFLKPMLKDYDQLKQNDAPLALTIGRWQHFNNANGLLKGLSLGLDWFDQYLKGIPATPQKPVCLYIPGQNEWVTFDEYPPHTQPHHYYLSIGKLDEQANDNIVSDKLVFDPQNPPPFIGGAQFSFDLHSYKSSQPIAQRPDTRVLMSAPLKEAITILGKPILQLGLSSPNPTCGLAVRLCSVQSDGCVANLCDGYAHFDTTVDPRLVEVPLWDTAYRFEVGERIQLIIAGGAYPHWVDHSDWHDNDLHLRHIHLHYTLESKLILPIYTQP